LGNIQLVLNRGVSVVAIVGSVLLEDHKRIRKMVWRLLHLVDNVPVLIDGTLSIVLR